MRGKIWAAIFALLCVAVPFASAVAADDSVNLLAEEYQVNLYRARVVEVAEELSVGSQTIQVLRIKILNRDFKDREATIRNTLVGNTYDIKLKAGDRISVHMEMNGDNEPSFYFNGYDRSFSLLTLAVIFIICVIVLGRMKGIKATIALALTILLIIFCLVPLLLRGYSPIILSIATCMLATLLTFSICFGFDRKSVSAILGVTGGLIVGGVIAYLFGILAKITGFSSKDAQMLQYLPNGYKYDFKGLLFAGIIISASGACMDVAITISSALTEIKSHTPGIENRKLIVSGFNIGRDAMVTMVNTLILAYTGSSLATLLIVMGFSKGFNEIINLESISTEVVRALSGSLGLLATIPSTILAFILLINVRGRKKCEK